ncbi:MAG: hypothetical protein KatS3mg105_0135 [Gemmatales bacterium]|nr:MAG: hypothetical protein KatS3mg105_0135 [Gemmatales bacterium]
MQYLRFGVLFIALSISSCYPSSGTLSPKAIRPLGERPRVFVVNYPLRYFAERIGGDYIEVHFPVPADIDPAFWRPDSQVIRGFQEADLILLNGAGYAKWLQMVSLPTSRMVNTTEAVRKKYILVKDGVTHQHGPEGKHTHAGTAFTTWLDPTIAIAQARSVKDALAKLSPEHASVFEANFAELEKDLAALDAEFEAVFAGVGQQPLLASHPVYQYLAQRYGLNLQSVHLGTR